MIFLSCGSNKKNRFELYNNGMIKLDKKTGQTWILGTERPDENHGYYKIVTED